MSIDSKGIKKSEGLKAKFRGWAIKGGSKTSGNPPIANPLTPTPMNLEIDRIKPYDRNPRRELNPRYDEIRASIQAQQGLNNPLTVTRRPDDERFMVEAGGNTRLKVLKELWKETKDEVFYRVNVLFVPWVSESHVLSAHLIENELRGGMVLIDKAFAVKDLMVQFEKESGEPLTRSGFQRRLETIGYKLSRRQLIRFEYATETLDAVIPQALCAGLGGKKIDEIRDLEIAYRRFCEDKSDQFDLLFADVMSFHDGEKWAIERMRRDLDGRLADLTDTPANRIHLEVDALLFERSMVDSEASAEVSNGVPGKVQSGDLLAISQGNVMSFERERDPSRQEREIPSDSDQRSLSEYSECSDGHESPDKNEPQSVKPEGHHRKPNNNTTSDWSDADETSNPYLTPLLNEFYAKGLAQESLSPDHLKSCRSRAYILAVKIGKAFGIADQVRSAAIGYGFLMEKPDGPIQKEAIWWGWWTLASLSEEMITPGRLELLSESGLDLPKLFADYQEDDKPADNPAFKLLGAPPGLNHFPHHFFLSPQTMSNQNFRDILLLVECCRFLRSHFPETVLWDCLTADQLRQAALFKELDD